MIRTADTFVSCTSGGHGVLSLVGWAVACSLLEKGCSGAWSVLRATMDRFTYSPAPIKKVQGVQFGVLDPDYLVSAHASPLQHRPDCWAGSPAL